MNKSIQDQFIRLAASDHKKLFELTINHYKKSFRDYIGIFSKQERLDGCLSLQQTMKFKFRETPFSMSFLWQKNPLNTDKLLYVEGRNNGKMIVHPIGTFLSWIPSITICPTDLRATKYNLRPCTLFGFHRNMCEYLNVLNEAEKYDSVYTASHGPFTDKLNQRTYITLERILSSKINNLCTNIFTPHRSFYCFDLEYLVPVTITHYDDNGYLIADYSYSQLNFNVGLNDDAFFF